jgi:hypothetical protein
MPRVVLTRHLSRHVDALPGDLPGVTVREVLDALFAGAPRLKSYVLDDQGAVRKHVVIFVDGEQIDDRSGLGDPLRADAEVYIMQALSGGHTEAR